METLIETVEQLKRSEVKVLIKTRINEFCNIKHGSINDIFKELCFLINSLAIKSLFLYPRFFLPI